VPSELPELLLLSGAVLSLVTFVASEVYLFLRRGFLHWFYTGLLWPYVWLQSFVGNPGMRAVSIVHLAGLALLAAGFGAHEFRSAN
jgi:hypothetical protein